MDIPFWPQLPNYSYYEDMYVQASEHFPGICLDLKNRKLSFSTEKFIAELEETLSHFEEPDYFDVSPDYSVVYRQFLDLDLEDRPAIRGQLEGPISFGFNVLDEDERPILFNDTVRPFMLEFMARRINVQLQKLKERNANAFMFVDEPGMQFLFSALAGYGDIKGQGRPGSVLSQWWSGHGGFICAATRIGTSCWGSTSMSCLWTSTPMPRSSPPMRHPFGSF